MLSFTAYSDQVYDSEECVRELLEQVESNLTFGKNTAGILLCNSECEFADIAHELQSQVDYPIVGCTTLGLIIRHHGFVNDGAALLVLTGDDVEFCTAATPALTAEGFREQITTCFEEAQGGHTTPCPLTICLYSNLVPSLGEEPLRFLNQISHGSAIFGGVASDDLSFEHCRTFCNGDVADHRLVILQIYGNITPLFGGAVCNNPLDSFNHKVTASTGHVVQALDERPFIEHLKEDPVLRDTIYKQGSLFYVPFICTYTNDQGAKISVMRFLHICDTETGSGIFLGDIPVGSQLKIATLKQDDIFPAVQDSIQSLLDRGLNDKKDTHKTLITVSCAARFLALGNHPELEAQACEDFLDSHEMNDISLLGFYSCGEICPSAGDDNTLYNAFHNFTFVTLAV